jgi:hypothetical protein
MKTWKLADADEELTRIVRQAVCCGAQRVTLDEDIQVVVLSAAEYARLTGEPAAAEEAADPDGTAETFRTGHGPTQESAAARAGDERKWIWEWDEETQSWALPWAEDADRAEYPGLPLLNFMQNSPLAQAFRDGDFTPEEWDAACRIGR